MDSQSLSESHPPILSGAENQNLNWITIVYLEQQNIIMIDTGNLTNMFSEKNKPSPATKKSIEEMPTVKVTEIGGECAICLEEHDVGGDVREMPCKHRFHSGCIEKWLGIHGSCPVCRYEMPLEKKGGGDDDVATEIQVTMFVSSQQIIGEADEDLD